MKKWLLFLLCIAMCVVPMSHAAAATYYIKYDGKKIAYKDTQAKVIIDGKTKSFSTPGILISGTAFVGAKDLVKTGLGGTYDYDSKTGNITLTYKGNTIKMKLGSKTATVNGKKETVSVAPTKIYFYSKKVTKVCVPSRFVAESFGIDYKWNADKGTITLTTSDGIKLYYDGKWNTYKGVQASVSVLGKKQSNGGMPSIELNSTVLVRAKQVFASSKIDADYDYDSKKKVLTLTKDDHTIVYTMDSTEALIDGEEVILPTAPRVIKNASGTGYVMVPGEVTALTFGYDYEWNSEKKLSMITDPDDGSNEDPDDGGEGDYKGLKLYYDGKWRDYTGTQGKVSVLGKKLSTGGMPSIIIDNTALLRAKQVFSTTLGADYSYESSDGTLTLKKGNITIRFTMGSKTAYVNGVAKELDTAPRVIKNAEGTGYVMVPGRFTANELGYGYTWNATAKTSYITEEDETSDEIITPTETFINQQGSGEASTISSLSDYVTLNGNGTEKAAIQTVSLTSSGSNYEQYTITADKAFGQIQGSVDSSGNISFAFYNASGTSGLDNLSGALVSYIDSVYSKEISTMSVTFATTSAAAQKYRAELSSDGKSLTVTIYSNYVNSLTAAASSTFDYVQIAGIQPINYSYTQDSNAVYLTLKNVQNGIGYLSQSAGNRNLMTSISVTSSGSDTLVTIYKSSNAAVKVTKTSKGCLVKFTGGTASDFTIQLPVSYNMVTTEDVYLEKRFDIILPGLYYDYFQSNPVTILNSNVTRVSTSIVNSNTVISIYTTKIMGFRLGGSGTSLSLKIGEPKEIYDKIIILDPGHGGSESPGAIKSGVYEKDMTFDILYTRAKKYFDSPSSTVKAYWTRTGDNNDKDLYDRAAFAKEVGADYFMSLHLNSYTDSGVNGTEVYYSSANNSTISNGLSSIKMAQFIEERLPVRVGLNRRTNAIRQAAYVVCKNNTVPAVLVELCYMTNASDMSKIKDETFRENTAKVLYDIVEELFQSYPTGR